MAQPMIPNLMNKADGVSSVASIVAAMRRDAQRVISAHDFVFNAYAVGNEEGAASYARALSAYYWSIGQRDHAAHLAAYGDDAR